MAGIRLVPEFPSYTGRFNEGGLGSMGTGACTLCNSHRPADDAGVVELGNNAQPYKEGMVVICFSCARQVGALAGMIGEDKAQRLVDERDQAVARAERLEELEAAVPRLLTIARGVVSKGEAAMLDAYGTGE
jgi:hypothetical protein